MFLVIVWTLTNHNFNDFAPLSRNQNHIFRCHTVTDSTDLRRSPQIGLNGGGGVELGPSSDVLLAWNETLQ